LNNNKKNIYTKKTITKQVKNTSKATKPESIVSTVEEKKFHGSQLTNTDVSPKNNEEKNNFQRILMISVLVVDKCWIDWDFFNAKLLFGQSNILPSFFLVVAEKRERRKK